MDDEAHLEIGRIAKAHGLRGEVVVSLVSDRSERMKPGAVFWSGDRQLTIEASRPHQDKFLVTFEGYHDRNGAESLHGLVLSAPPLEDEDALWVHELIGCRVVDVAGRPLGVVEAVEANPASDLLVLADGGLIPLTFFVELNDGAIVVDPPSGLLDAD